MSGLSTGAVVGLFVLASLGTWVAGLTLADTTDLLDERFGLGEALGGLILLGFAGTLPEIAVTVSAAQSGNLDLATGNLLGGIAMQTLVLVLLDGISGSSTPLTSLSTVLEPIVEALLVILLLAIALLGHLFPASVAIGSVSPTSLMLVIVWLGGVQLLNRLRTSQRWRAVSEHIEAVMVSAPPPSAGGPGRFGRAGTRPVLIAFGTAAVVTLVAGVVLERASDELAGRWGLTGVVFGATILAAVTALPGGQHRPARGPPRACRPGNGRHLRRQPGSIDAVPGGRSDRGPACAANRDVEHGLAGRPRHHRDGALRGRAGGSPATEVAGDRPRLAAGGGGLRRGSGRPGTYQLNQRTR